MQTVGDECLLKGKTALVVGGSGGIGKAVAKAFLKNVKIACCGMAPVLYAKLVIDRNRKGLEADKGKFMDVEE